MRVPPLVLCYHAITDGWEHALAVGPSTFERQVASCVRRGLRPVPAQRVLEGNRRDLHVTFDDAFVSVQRVLPVLERLGVPATVFACPGYADEGRALDVPELAAEAAAHPHELETMNWGALRELVERGVEVGSHTLSHAHLTRLSDGELGAELRESRERLETELQRPCPFLAYPYGEEDERVHAAARAARYEAAFALPGTGGRSNRYALPRVGIYRKDGGVRAALKTSPARRLVPLLHGLRRPRRV
jgi:peptidoglycan/xylan/chitin deacetylase (PgdA/CDA1 family)